MSTPSSPVKPTLSSLDVDLSSFPSNSSYDQVSPSTSRGRSFSQVKLPSFRISAPGSPKSPSHRSPGYEHPSAAQQSDPTQRYRDESRKLLAHILGQLRDRKKPESVFRAFKSDGTSGTESRDLRTTVRAIQGAVKLRAGLSNQSETSTQDDNDSDNEEGSYSTDSTFDLLSQFVSALSVAVNAGWQIFDDGYEVPFGCDNYAQSRLTEIRLRDPRWRFPQTFHGDPLVVNPAVDHGPLHLSEGGSVGCQLQTSFPIQSLSSLPSFPRIVVSRSRLHAPPVLQMHSNPWYWMPQATSYT